MRSDDRIRPILDDSVEISTEMMTASAPIVLFNNGVRQLSTASARPRVPTAADHPHSRTVAGLKLQEPRTQANVSPIYSSVGPEDPTINSLVQSRISLYSHEPAPRLDLLRATPVLVIDDCTLHRDNLVAAFVSNGIQPPGVAWDLPSMMAALEDTKPTVVLLGLTTRGNQLLLRALMDIDHEVRVVVFEASEERESDIIQCAEAGVAGYHMRTESLDDLFGLIQRVAAGESSCPPRISAILLTRLSALASQRRPPPRKLALTAREAQILSMLELGRSNRDIAQHLSIAVHTVKNHVHSLLTKLGVGTRAEAAAISRSVLASSRVKRN